MISNRFALYVVVAILVYPFHTVQAEEGSWVISKNLKMEGQVNIDFYNANDAPEGAYMAKVRENLAETLGTVQLGKTLPAGKYNVFLKAIDYSKVGKARISIGGSAESEIPFNNEDWNKYWTVPATITAPTAFTSVVIKFRKTLSLPEYQAYLFRGIYITPKLTEDFVNYGFDKVADYTYPTKMDTSPPLKGNLMPCSSFEGGYGCGWGWLQESYARDYPQSTMPTTADFFHGKKSIKVPGKGRIISPVLRVASNKKHTLSVWVKSPVGGGSLSISHILHQVEGFPSDKPAVTSLTTEWNPNPNWQRVSVSGDLLGYPNPYYVVRISTNPGTLIDAVQLEEGDLSDFTPRAEVEFSLVTSTPGRVYFEDEPLLFSLEGWSSRTAAASGTIRYEIYDYLNRKVTEGFKSLTFGKNAAIRESLNFGTIGRGIFRVVLRADGVVNGKEEVVFSVVPRPSTMSADPLSIIGIHPVIISWPE